MLAYNTRVFKVGDPIGIKNRSRVVDKQIDLKTLYKKYRKLKRKLNKCLYSIKQNTGSRITKNLQ